MVELLIPSLSLRSSSRIIALYCTPADRYLSDLSAKFRNVLRPLKIAESKLITGNGCAHRTQATFATQPTILIRSGAARLLAGWQ